ncbi:HEPN/Toprim-associated domain-containing protein [Flavobacterium sp. UBA7682]|uniref:HEPN/Toprim-associated domain-containing protein n=1 Tax=Flavobacterium sp. UBA7682 TaxID=1946560 RepID=UPI0025B92C72|nr:HEPN/Toprim-associated domain-containing protein [Flavobacterium sp. UBA7682]
MGSYSHISFNDYPIFTNKNSYNHAVVNSLFLPEDFIVEERLNATRNKIAWGIDDNDFGKYIFKGFVQTAKICKERLEIYGNSLSIAKKDFEKARIVSREEFIYDFPIGKVTYKNYLNELSIILKNKEKNYNGLYENLKESLIANELSIIGQSIPGFLYSILSVIPEDSIIEYDLTEVIYGGWVKESETKQITIEKIIVLGEGKTDTEFISKSLQKLYPHLFPYYHFMDFDEFKVESNASALVKLVTALAASNVKHPIIVIFDNDTTGIMEMKRLAQLNLPLNIRVLKYPDLNSAKSYPTIGPTGAKKMNVNGLACGIEMYFGRDVLNKGNSIIPIQWKAYNEKEKQYQGEISEKIYTQEKFREKLKSTNKSDFEDIELILKSIFGAFSIRTSR